MDYSGKIIKKTPVTPSQTSASGVWTLDDAVQAQKTNTWPVANVPNPISRSLRFRSSASARLTRTYTATGSTQIFTGSVWVKRGTLGSSQTFFGAQNTAATTWDYFNFNASDQIQLFIDPGTTPYNVITSSVFRDPSAWYHIVFAVDTTQATASNRVRIYVNGVEQPLGTNTIPQNYNLRFNVSGNTAGIATQVNYLNTTGPVTVFDGYFAEVYWVDGQQLTPSSFGGTNATTGVWEPRAYTGTYGTNGFYLNFKDNTSTTTLGYDYSGNSNNWTTNNISLTAGSTYDSMLDVPTQWIGYNTGDVASVTRGNYCTLNPLENTGTTLSQANLYVVPGSDTGVKSTMAIPSSGKFYWEVLDVSQGNRGAAGIYRTNQAIDVANLVTSPYGISYAYWAGAVWQEGSNVGTYSTVTTNDIIMFAVDADNGKFYVGKNGTWFNSGAPASGTGYVASLTSGQQYTPWVCETGGTPTTSAMNFGQRPFSYTPPTGYQTLCTTNLSSPTILQGNQYFDATLYTGNGSTNTITNAGGFQPDLVWAKDRGVTNSHRLVDAVRGATKSLFSNLTDAEATESGLTSFNSNGFTVGSANGMNYNTEPFVAWQWKGANGTVSNTAGSITSTVSANTTSGFSVVTYTGTGSNATVGHGLGVAPKMVIVKNRNNARLWPVYHASIGAGNRLVLNDTAASSADSGTWNSTAPNSTVFYIGTSSATNNSGSDTYVAYCFSEVAGFSKFGSYTGNGSTDGTFTYLGFKPAFVMRKRTDSTSDWVIADDARNPNNEVTYRLYANLSDAEGGEKLDFLSNGFKETGAGAMNQSGASYIYMAFAENPFKYSLAR